MISDAVNSKTSAGSREMMSSICQAMTSVSGGVAACTAEKEVAMAVDHGGRHGEDFGISRRHVSMYPSQRSERLLLR